ncbi:MAG TPA: CDP-diacylglycerol--serine O-phosphatidyltransferase [Campylobacterales bacterium]|nr:CDP-diacylglycerol--serine O-phosphatidyltransferase [Campylobacterales bacterium]
MIKINEEKNKFAFLLPNSITAVSLFLGILSVFASVKGEFENAGIYIFLSLIFDGLDGRLARMTGTCSKFGVEFDSLADLVAFGVAPAMLVYFAAGHEFGKTGVLAAGFFVVFGAIRLARFNVQSGCIEPNAFIGLPIPSAAVFITCWTVVLFGYGLLKEYSYLIMAATFIIALLMVSNIRYASFKKMPVSKRALMRVFILILSILAVMFLYFLETLTALITFFVLSGIVRAAYNLTIFKLKNRHPQEVKR